jgi:hypothetical protein
MGEAASPPYRTCFSDDLCLFRPIAPIGTLCGVGSLALCGFVLLPPFPGGVLGFAVGLRLLRIGTHISEHFPEIRLEICPRNVLDPVVPRWRYKTL